MKPIRHLASSIAVAIVSLTISSAYAATISVTTTTDSGAGSLRQAVATAAAGDTIAFSLPAGAVIKLTSGPILLTKDVTIAGPGWKNLGINGSKRVRVFSISPNTTISIADVTISGGKIAGSGTGGGIYADTTTLYIDRCYITGHAASIGAALALERSTAFITDSQFASNAATTNAGAILNYEGTVFLDGTAIWSATANILGGAIYNVRGDVDLTNCTLSGNSAQRGAAILNDGGTVFTHNVTISKNKASYLTGGLLSRYGGSAIIANTIIAGNTAPSQPDFSGDATSSQDSLGSSIIGNATGSTITKQGTGDVFGTTAAPVDPRLGALADNGGPSLTMELLPGSPAYNHGDSDLAVDYAGNPLTTDQRGSRRVAQSKTDIGAFEVIAPREEIRVALEGIPAGDSKSATAYASAKSSLTSAYDFAYWPEDSHLSTTGAATFTNTSQATTQLIKVTKLGTAYAAVAQPLINDLVASAYWVTRYAIDEAATTPGVNATKLAAARTSFKQAETFYTGSKYSEAIATFGAAWKNAKQSIGWTL